MRQAGELICRAGDGVEIPFRKRAAAGDDHDVLHAKVPEGSAPGDKLIGRLTGLQRRGDGAFHLPDGPADIGAVPVQHVELSPDRTARSS